ncbi:reverse transcriptase domain-containing protein [Nannocystis pusilla]|uniref:reverse transcriptase domain-containing protein n=1 Tax=Nannocystis pusilla TaxID=889268 RepID=UPI003B80ACDB
MLANIYLHEVLDQWWVSEVLPRMRGEAFLIRFADDFVICFEHADDATRVQVALAQRFARYGLTLHPGKTRLLPFRRSRDGGVEERGPGTTRSFDFLGFTHYWGKSRSGGMVVKRATMRSRFTRTVRAIAEKLRQHMHETLTHHAKIIGAKLKGFDSYYGITGNGSALKRLRYVIERVWWKILCRRSQKGYVLWEGFYGGILKRFPMPPPRVVHSVYTQRTSGKKSRMR